MTPLMIAGIAAGALLVILLAVIIIRTLSFPIETEPTEPLALLDIDGEAVARRVGLAVQCRTISHKNPAETDPKPFSDLRDLLRTLYPQLHEKLDCELINDRSLLFTWRGSDPKLDAICFAAHQDVVPADESPEAGWTHPPFAGELADGRLDHGKYEILERYPQFLRFPAYPAVSLYHRQKRDGFRHDY